MKLDESNNDKKAAAQCVFENMTFGDLMFGEKEALKSAFRGEDVGAAAFVAAFAPIEWLRTKAVNAISPNPYCKQKHLELDNPYKK